MPVRAVLCSKIRIKWNILFQLESSKKILLNEKLFCFVLLRICLLFFFSSSLCWVFRKKKLWFVKNICVLCFFFSFCRSDSINKIRFQPISCRKRGWIKKTPIWNFFLVQTKNCSFSKLFLHSKQNNGRMIVFVFDWLQNSASSIQCWPGSYFRRDTLLSK